LRGAPGSERISNEEADIPGTQGGLGGEIVGEGKWGALFEVYGKVKGGKRGRAAHFLRFFCLHGSGVVQKWAFGPIWTGGLTKSNKFFYGLKGVLKWEDQH